MNTFFKPKKITTLASTLLVGLLVVVQAHALDKGKPAPAFELNGSEATVKLSKYQGKLVYLDFWASWCGPCRQSFPWMNELQSKYGARGLQIIAVNLDSKNEDAKNFLSTTPARFVVAFDPAGATPRSYGVKGMPSSFLIDQDGKLVHEHSGFRESDKEELENKIKSLLGSAK